MTMKRLILVAALAAIIPAATADAQFEKDWKEWYGHVFGGYSMPQGDMSDVAKEGWTLGGGFAYYPNDWLVGLTGEIAWSDHGIQREILDAFESSGGDVTIWSLTGGVVWSPRLDGSFGFTLSAGVGPYRTEGRLTEPGVVCGPVCPPYSWWCFPGCGPGTIVTDRATSTDIGYNLGIGFSFEVGLGSEIYFEAKYHRIETDVAAEYIPINIGYRW
jgi:opacity protein-like surface antigen